MDTTSSFFNIPIITIIVIVITTFTYTTVQRVLLGLMFRTNPKLSSSSDHHHPPSPPLRLPVLGHLHHLVFTDTMPHHTFTKLSKDMNTPIFQLQLGKVPTVIISSPHLAKLVLKTHDSVFSNRPRLLSAQYLSFNCSDVTFSPYGPYWRQARKVCVTELLGAKRVNSFKEIRDREVNRCLSTLAGRVGQEVNMSEVFFTLVNDILCSVAFGRRFFYQGQNGNLADSMVRVLTETQELFAGFCLGDFYPKWGWVNWVSGYKRRLERNLKELRGVCDEIISEHLIKRDLTSEDLNGGFDGDYSKEDFVDVLLRVQKRKDLEVPITDDNLKALVLDMFVAGTDTSSSILEWTMTELARHPKVMQKVQDEVRRYASVGGTIEESDLHCLQYMKAVIKETMRLHPPVPLLVPRESTQDCILDGFIIPAKSRVMINYYAISRDPDLWEDPLKFDPERFVDADVDHFTDNKDFKFLPFGGGRRGCPGYGFGLATIEIALARLLCHFDWALPTGLDAENMELDEIFGLATRKKSALVLVPTSSKEHEFKART